MKRTSIPLRTSISIGLKSIPLSAGLARKTVHNLPPRVGHRIKGTKKSPLVMTVEKDTALEEEMRAYKEGK